MQNVNKNKGIPQPKIFDLKLLSKGSTKVSTYHTLCKEHPLSNDSFKRGESSPISPNNISANDCPPDID